MKRNTKAFTIVELLIVIVVIAIISTILIITIVGAQGRANNTARIDAASKLVRAISVYHTQSGSGAALMSAIPTNSSACAGSGYEDINNDGRGDCYYYGNPPTVAASTSPTIDSLLSTTSLNGRSPKLEFGNTSTGPLMTNYPSTIDGRAANLQVRYYLEGANVNCGLRVLKITGSTYTATGSLINTSVSGNVTICIVDMSQYEK